MPAPDHPSIPRFLSTRPWQEGLILFLGIGGMIAIGYAVSGFSLVQQTVIWLFMLLALAVVARRGWLKLFGPVLFYDLIRTARRTRYFLIRIVYTSFLLALLAWLFVMWNIDLSRRGGLVRATDMASFAASFFYTFMSVQFILVTLLTPAATAGAIAEEKERRTLEFILATDLDNREIVLSKLLSRLLNISFLLLAGLPILSILQFLGGVDPGLVLAGFAATAVTAASLAGLSIFYSTISKRAGNAIVRTYLTAFAYLILSGMSGLLAGPPLNWGTFPSTSTWTSPITVQDLVEWFNAGNFVAAFLRLSACVQGGGHLESVLPSELFQYAVFHGIVLVGAALGAIWRLRTAALKEMYGKERKPSLRVRLIGRPQVSDRPMLWKEIYAEPGLRSRWIARIVLVLLIVASFISPAMMLAEYYFGQRRPGEAVLVEYNSVQQALNIWVRTVGTAAACLALLGAAVRAAGSISTERDQKTLDELLVTPLTSKEILAAKWVGSILNVRWAWAWLGLIWLLGVATGGLHITAVPLLAAAWLVYAAGFAAIGLWCSMTCRSTLRAVVWTLLTVGMVSVGHWLVTALTCCTCMSPVRVIPGGIGLEWLTKLQVGFTPPFVLGYLAFSVEDFKTFHTPTRFDEYFGFSIFGIVCWAIGTAALWSAMNERFRAITGRDGRTPLRSKTSRNSASQSAGEAADTCEDKKGC